MPIVASCVAYQKVVVAEDKLTPATRQVVAKMLERLPRHDTRCSYQYENYVYHFFVENEIFYLCVSDKVYQARTVYGFLSDVKVKFREQFAGDKSYPHPAEITQKNCAKFASVLTAQTKLYNDNPEADKIGRIKEQIDNVKQVMLENLDNLLERGERIDTLCDKTEMLKEEAQGFHNNARTLKKKMWLRNVKILIAGLLLLCLLGLVIAFIACGIDFHKCKSDATPAPATTTVAPSTAAPVAPAP